MSSTFSYPRVHVVGSGAYYSYRPITRYIEKADRSFIRESSSRPKDFSQYGSVASSRGDGFVRAPSFDTPHFDASRERKKASDKADDLFYKRGHDDSFLKHGEDDSIFKRGHGDSFSKRSPDDSFLKHGHDDSFSKHAHDDLLSKHMKEDSHYKQRKEESSSFLKKAAEESLTERVDHDALFARNEDVLARLRRKHPYRLPVENEVVPPHESSIWPENRPHFDLVSSYDTMVDFLGIREKSKN